MVSQHIGKGWVATTTTRVLVAVEIDQASNWYHRFVKLCLNPKKCSFLIKSLRLANVRVLTLSTSLPK